MEPKDGRNAAIPGPERGQGPRPGRLPGLPAVPAAAAFFAAAALREMYRIGKPPAVYPGTPSTIVRNGHLLHLNPVNPRLWRNQNNPARDPCWLHLPGAGCSRPIYYIMQESRLASNFFTYAFISMFYNAISIRQKM
ncbi:hypothetical protein [Desulfosarcina alkanivorans]|uniref:hypothetical protein n=1 Tax=Desulfosarcina alkanivorans TaxID=571177 RepID=UPI0012D2E2A8|nr:hypothetical protein [Desulfosarcina alkanivorans]